ncbi:MAG TPA: transporter [Flavobacterium sp.]|nr:transporter [Flavobacterium sp.]
MKTVFRFILVALLSLSPKIFSQETNKPEPIETDRPDQTETPTIIPKGTFQMETGFSYEKANEDESSTLSPTVLFKYGVNGNFELRLITEYTTNKFGDDKISGLNPVLVGFKVKLAEEKGILPKTSFLGHLLIPDLASKELRADYYATEFRFSMQHTLSDKVNLSYNLGAEWDGVSPEATFAYTMSLGIELTNKMNTFLEVYGFAPQNDKADHRFDTGLTYLISDNFMIDASGGFGMTENAPDYFASAGFSFRL